MCYIQKAKYKFNLLTLSIYLFVYLFICVQCGCQRHGVRVEVKE